MPNSPDNTKILSELNGNSARYLAKNFKREKAIPLSLPKRGYNLSKNSGRYNR
ncbi:MAG: hypothetical protein QG670_2498 [Thermoproteota archaeon]|nr:hypothetical protein [Thermoproteota archaeon]